MAQGWELEDLIATDSPQQFLVVDAASDQSEAGGRVGGS
jgi:hypothetical protein